MSEFKINKAFLNGLNLALMGNLNFIYYGNSEQLKQCSHFLKLYLKYLVSSNVYFPNLEDTQINFSSDDEKETVFISDLSRHNISLLRHIENILLDKSYYVYKNGKTEKKLKILQVIMGKSKIKGNSKDSIENLHHIAIDMNRNPSEIILDDDDILNITDRNLSYFYSSVNHDIYSEYKKSLTDFTLEDFKKFFNQKKEKMLLDIINLSTEYKLSNAEVYTLKIIIILLTPYFDFSRKENIERVIKKYMNK